MPFTLRNLKGDLKDVGSNFDGAPDLEILVIGAPRPARLVGRLAHRE